MSPLERLGRDVVEGLGTGPDPFRRARQRAALLEAADTLHSRRSRRFGWGGLAAAGAVAVAAAILLPRVLDGTTAPGDTTAAMSVADGPLSLRFGATGSVVLEAHARVTVAREDAREVVLALERGAIEVDAQPADGRRWMVRAGPYGVLARTARFTVAWTPTTQTLVVAVIAGRVTVSGHGLGDGGVSVAAGERFEIGSIDPSDERAPADPPRDAAPTQAATNRAPSAKARPVLDAAQQKAPRSSKVTRWMEHAARGDYASAMQALDDATFERLLARGTRTDLDRLATAARLGGHPDRAERALRALHRRFPRTDEGTTAAFLLGRLLLERRNRPAEAARWFRTYLDEAPRGPLADHARGRRLEALVRAGNAEAARSAARDYLEHAPTGEYADLARLTLR